MQSYIIDLFVFAVSVFGLCYLIPPLREIEKQREKVNSPQLFCLSILLNAGLASSAVGFIISMSRLAAAFFMQ